MSKMGLLNSFRYLKKKLWPRERPSDAPQSSLELKNESKGEDRGRRRSWARSLVCNTSGVEGCVGASGWGLRRLKNKSITNTDLHKPNNKLISA